ncbi:DUF3575 domain-containing protein [Lacibacter sediminis]|uniref:DUF3575 domain-containing protein n=1 Tax=Lacibacter sediminis TaxID=2760713 RepID=A0A7G5XBF7_9BACT|nr:DUF3575 domain-containing protein [Lacibacter sediminis]QNA42810.1 DUF3575 domain-containing protein [Lacibacter sediminis]
MYNKKILTTLLFCALSITSLVAQSTLDEQSGGAAPVNVKPSVEKTDKHKMNILKVNLMALALKNYSFQYERVLTKKISVAVGIRSMPTGGLPFLSNYVDDIADGDPDLEANLRALKVGNFAITPEVRFYLNQKGYGRGFYIAPYYRYAKFNSDELPITFDGDANTTKTIKLKGDVITHSGGLMIGAQWHLGKVVTLDWWILGAHYGTSNGTLSGTPSSSLSANEQTEIKNTIESLELPLTKITAEVSANNIKAIVDGPWAGVRAGLTIGIKF